MRWSLEGTGHVLGTVFRICTYGKGPEKGVQEKTRCSTGSTPASLTHRKFGVYDGP